MAKYIFITADATEAPELAQHNGYYTPEEAEATATILGCKSVDVSICKTNDDYNEAIKKAAE